MAKLQIPIDDNLMKSLKKHALDNGMTLKDLVISTLERIIANTSNTDTTSIIEETAGIHEALTSTTNTSNTSITEKTSGVYDDLIKASITANTSITTTTDNTPDYDDPFSDPDPMDERYFYIIRKTHTLGMITEEDGPSTTNGTVRWEIPVGCYRNFDKDGYLIPFRYTTPEGRIVQPTEEQLEELKQKYDKQGVTVEV